MSSIAVSATAGWGRSEIAASVVAVAIATSVTRRRSVVSEYRNFIIYKRSTFSNNYSLKELITKTSSTSGFGLVCFRIKIVYLPGWIVPAPVSVVIGPARGRTIVSATKLPILWWAVVEFSVASVVAILVAASVWIFTSVSGIVVPVPFGCIRKAVVLHEN